VHATFYICVSVILVCVLVTDVTVASEPVSESVPVQKPKSLPLAVVHYPQFSNPQPGDVQFTTWKIPQHTRSIDE
jgi:hypothetical protein